MLKSDIRKLTVELVDGRILTLAVGPGEGFIRERNTLLDDEHHRPIEIHFCWDVHITKREPYQKPKS